MFKKSVLLLLVCLLSIGFMFSVSAEENNDYEYLLSNDNVVKTDDSFEYASNISGYYPFIYSTDKLRTWANDNVIGKGSFEEGCLYAKNLDNNTTKLLVNQPVAIFRESNDNKGIYFILNNSIFWVDYE